MTDLVEAAARATCARQLYATVWDTLNDGSQDSYRAAARAALLAALEAVDVEEVARALFATVVEHSGCIAEEDWEEHERAMVCEARAVLAHLRKLVEGADND